MVTKFAKEFEKICNEELKKVGLEIEIKGIKGFKTNITKIPPKDEIRKFYTAMSIAVTKMKEKHFPEFELK